MNPNKTGIIICTRANSSRIYKKPFQKLGLTDKCLIEYLVESLLPLNIEIIVALPTSDIPDYANFIKKYHEKISFYYGNKTDPLKRMRHAADLYNIDTIIRITHDKVFIDNDLVKYALKHYSDNHFEYLFSSHFTEGCGFEIIDYKVLETANFLYKDVEHISYAIKNLTKKICNLNLIGTDFSYHVNCDHRFLVDYPEDIILLNYLFITLGDNFNLRDAIYFLDQSPHISKINRMPIVTFYTCIKNGEKYINDCIESVIKQSIFRKSEYIIIDDGSTDNTFSMVKEYSDKYKNIKVIRNKKNKGLASCSNMALKFAKGKWILRVDHDDYLINKNSTQQMIQSAIISMSDILYPDNYFGDLNIIQKGNECHHVGGALFLKKNVNYIKFTSELSGYEGLDFFVRSKDVLKISYYPHPTFFYRQHNDSMSKNNLDERDRLKAKILEAKE